MRRMGYGSRVAAGLAVALLALAGTAGRAEPPGQEVVRVSDGDNYERVTVPLGAALHVRLSANATTGYSWRLTSGGGQILKPLDDGVYRPGPGNRPGAGGNTIFRFNAVRPGATRLVFNYVQVGGEQGRTFVVYARVAGAGPWPGPTPPKTVYVDDSDNREQITVPQGNVLQVTLKANATTGYSWRISQNNPNALVPLGEPQYSAFPADNRVGSGGTTTFRFRAQRPGLYTLVLTYRQVQNSGPGGRTFRVQVFIV